MRQTIKANIQILVILGIATAFLIGISMVIGTGVQPQLVAAQQPLPSPSFARSSFTEEKLAAFGISLRDVEAAAGPHDLQVTVSVSPGTVPSGGSATFTVAIKNLSTSNTAQYLLFSQSLPGIMSGGSPNFGGLTAINNGANPPTWLITNPIAPNGTIQFTVSGSFTSACSTLANYTANVIPFDSLADPILTNNTASAGVNVTTGTQCTFFPLIRRDPTPTPNPIVFFDNFSGDRNWPTADDSDCERSYTNDEYEIQAKTKEEICFGPAPGAAEREFGTVRVKARRESGSSNFTVAVYINGSGDENYYALEVNPDDDCRWRLIRRRSGNSDTVRSGGCDSPINRDSGSNILEIRHFSNGDVSVFINGTQLGSTYNDGSQLSGRGTGVFARTNNDDDVSVRFDDFTVIRP